MLNQDALLKLCSTSLSVSEIMDKFEQELKAKQIMIFARINHGQAANEVGMSLNDEEVLIFGNPKAGTPLMQEYPIFGIELPLKILAFRQNDKTWVVIQNLKMLAEQMQVPVDNPTLLRLDSFLKQLVDNTLEKCEVK